MLTLGGTAFLYLAPWVAAAVVVLLSAVVLSYRQLVKAYPTGGGDYEVSTKNIGRAAGVVVASALLVDYVMTVSVSVSSGVDNIISAVPSLHQDRLLMALGFVAILTAVNLRGVREAGFAFAVPTYMFTAGVFIMIGTGLIRTAVGDAPVAESAHYRIHTTQGYGSLGDARADLPDPAGVLVRLHRADRGRGHRQRRARLPAAEGPQRAEDARDHGRPRDHDVRRRHRARADRQGAHHRPDHRQLPAAGRPELRAHTAAHRHRPGGRRRVRRRTLARVLLPAGHDGADPGAGGQHRVQRLPAAGLDPGPGQQPAAPAEQPRRPAGLQQRHRRPGRGRRRPDRDLRRRHHAADPALHHRRVHLVHARPDGMVRHWNRLLRTERDPGERRRHTDRPRSINAFGASFTGLVLSSSSSPSSPRAPTWC